MLKVTFTIDVLIICVFNSLAAKIDIDSEEVIRRKVIENPKLFEGDIVMVPAPRVAQKAAMHLWPRKTIPYEFNSAVNYSLQSQILKAMKHISNKTCLKFKRRTKEKDYIYFIRAKGCYSYIGRIKGRQPLSIGIGCEPIGTIIHEVMHAIGFFHHHSRADRDDYLVIHWNNIQQQFYDQFHQVSASNTISFSKFDYNSIMMYGPRAFSKDRSSITISPKKKGVVLKYSWQKSGLSARDAYSINKLYSCG